MPRSREQTALLKRLGESVQRERLKAGLTQEKLAGSVGLYPRSLQKIEAGEINVPVTTLDRIRSVLGCKWGNLLDKP
ncbi:MAG: helix-turn-helix transcriptional regulator [Limisphaerales bacterium]